MSDIPEMPFTCPLCVTWSCDLCGYRIYYQNPNYEGTRRCRKCGSSIGTMSKVKHTSIELAVDHWEQYQFEQMAEKDRPYAKSFDQGATTIARLERDEKAMPTGAALHTAEDFAEAKWCLHTDGSFGRRDSGNLDRPWVVIVNSRIYWHSDQSLADQGGFEPFKPSLTIDVNQLRKIIERCLPGHDFPEFDDIVYLVREIGVKVTEARLDLPSEPGVRFKAKKADGPVEWKFVTYFNGRDFAPGVICTDTKDYTGQTWSADQFDAIFTVTELL